MSVNGPLSAPQDEALAWRRQAPVLRTAPARTRTATAALAVVLAAGAILALCAGQTDALLPESIRPAPSWLTGALGSAGISLGAGLVIALGGVMFGAYVLAVRRAHELTARAVIAAILALHALMLLAPAIASTDIFSYQAYARMFAVYGSNPYLHGPHAIALDAVYPFIGAKWVGIPSAYGPLFTALSAALAPLTIAGSVLAYKALAAAASLAVVGLVWNIAGARGVDPVKAAAIVGLNPLVVLYGVGGGHNDLLMLVGVMAGVAFLLAHRDRAGGASIVLAAGVKMTGGLLAPFAWAGLRPRARRRELTIGGALAALGVAALSFSLFGAGSLNLITTLTQSQSKGDWHSIAGFISTRLGLPVVGLIVGLLLAAVFLGVLAWLLRRVWRDQLDWIDGAAWATAALLVTASSLLPWYVAWLMPLAAVSRDRRLVTAALTLSGVDTALELLGYFPHLRGLAL